MPRYFRQNPLIDKWLDVYKRQPLNMFLNDKTLDMPFMFCWANENWTKRFSGTNDEILIGMENTKENYKAFIHEVIPFFSDPRYFLSLIHI